MDKIADWITRTRDYVAATPAAFLAVMLAVFVVLVNLMNLNTVITILNGVFAGTMFGLIVAYGSMFWQAFFNQRRYGVQMEPSTKRFALSVLASWIAYAIVAYTSIKIRATDGQLNVMLETAISRFLVIIAAVGQITSADAGEDAFYGRDRKALWLGVAVGLVVAAFTVYVQENKTFAMGALSWRI